MPASLRYFRPSLRVRYALLGLIVAAAGCATEGPVSESPASEATAAESPAEIGAAEPESAKEKPAEPGKPKAAKRRDVAAVTAAAWTAPFPDRNDLFEPPRYSGRTRNIDSDDSSDSVVLLGFADVGAPRVVLAIDGVVTPLAGGGEHAGVKVIAIAPPKAVLQRGRTRWTASIQ